MYCSRMFLLQCQCCSCCAVQSAGQVWKGGTDTIRAPFEACPANNAKGQIDTLRRVLSCTCMAGCLLERIL